MLVFIDQHPFVASLAILATAWAVSTLYEYFFIKKDDKP